MYAPTRTRAVHHPKDLWALCRCGGANGRAILGHMPGSCSYAQVHGFLPAQRKHSRRRMLHSKRHAQARGFCLQGFPFECFDQLGPSLAGSAKQLQAEEAPHKTLVMRILALKLQF